MGSILIGYEKYQPTKICWIIFWKLVRTTTPKSVITVSTVRLPIKDHAHWQDTPTELIVHDNVAEPVFKASTDPQKEPPTLGKVWQLKSVFSESSTFSKTIFDFLEKFPVI